MAAAIAIGVKVARIRRVSYGSTLIRRPWENLQQTGRLEIFARGSDGAVWHKWQTAPSNGWSGWESLGGWIDRLAVAGNAP
ncbi:hypothetical protein [Streptomyces sp. DSM 15324]|uniref:hypothetical protein n=1 Tax=Streptomyces sp. DSM 15324 TaxID=1739111 RepID=UPI00099EB07B|nr:hypothetical protein [Streptomyces sp. DSM 15324]